MTLAMEKKVTIWVESEDDPSEESKDECLLSGKGDSIMSCFYYY
jgi:hypothetical protein